MFVGDEHEMDELRSERGLRGSKVGDDAGVESSQEFMGLGMKEFELSLKNTLGLGRKLAEGHERESSRQRQRKVPLNGDLVDSGNSRA